MMLMNGSGSRKSVCPATGETISLVRAVSGLIALSKASGPSTYAPVIWPRAAGMVVGDQDLERPVGHISRIPF